MPKKQTEWSRNYNERAYDRLAITVPKGQKAAVESAATRRGISINALVNALLMAETGQTADEWKNPNQSHDEGATS